MIMLSYLLLASCCITLHAMHQSDVGSLPGGDDQIMSLAHPTSGRIMLLAAPSNDKYIYAVPVTDNRDPDQGHISIPSISSEELEQNCSEICHRFQMPLYLKNGEPLLQSSEPGYRQILTLDELLTDFVEGLCWIPSKTGSKADVQVGPLYYTTTQRQGYQYFATLSLGTGDPQQNLPTSSPRSAQMTEYGPQSISQRTLQTLRKILSDKSRPNFTIGVIGATTTIMCAAQRFDPFLAIGSGVFVSFYLLIRRRTGEIKNLWRNEITE